jgi:hypothetical protein
VMNKVGIMDVVTSLKFSKVGRAADTSVLMFCYQLIFQSTLGSWRVGDRLPSQGSVAFPNRILATVGL